MPAPTSRTARITRTAKITAFGSALAVALAAGLLMPASAERLGRAARPATVIPDATDCPDVLPISSVTPGMTGQGLTVVRGATPQPFAVEVLGVLQNGIGAGRDMIMIEVSDLPGRQVVSAGGGIWAGMSGSPVYIDGKLLGAVSYGFTLAPSPIGGVTPAADMLNLLDLPAPAAHNRSATSAADKMSLSATARRTLTARAEAAVPAGSLEPLTVPMSVSGLTSRRLKRFQTEAKKADLPVIAYAGSRHAAPATATSTALARPTAGGNFAAAMSYGDVTLAGVGTTTAICGDQAVAFGHPLQLIGKSSYGANDASSLSIIKDDTLGSFKLANIGAQFGRVDQDRLSAIRADLTRVPALTPIKSTIRNSDTHQRRRGMTLAADSTSLPLITGYGLLANYDTIFDETGDARASTTWRITGRRAGNVPFTVKRSNKFAAQSDVTYDAASDASDAVSALLTNEFEPVTIDHVSFLSSVTTTYQQWTITRMEISVNGGPFRSPGLLTVRGGETLKVRVGMRPYRSSAVKTSTLRMKVPGSVAGRSGSLVVTGGADLAGKGYQASGQSLNSLITGIRSQPRNDEVVARLVLDSLDGGTRSLTRTARKRQAETVAGERDVAVQVG